MSHLTFTNALPWWAVSLVIGAIAAIAWRAYAHSIVPRPRRDVLIALRFVTLAALVLFLMRPIRTTDSGRTDVFVPVLVDGSRSMGIEDADGQRRIDRARDLVTREIQPALGNQFHLDILSFGDRLRETSPADLAATDRQSDLSGALAAVGNRYRGRPVAGVVVISDGGDTSAMPSADATLPPIYAFGVGSRTMGRDREVTSVTAAEAVADDSRIDLAVSAVSHGTGTEPIALQLVENGRPIEVRRIAPAAEGIPVHTVFQVTPGRGSAVVYSVQVPVVAGELVPENNRRSVLVQPPSRQHHVLFVEGAPGFEHSFLKRAWAADPGLDIDSIVRKGKTDQGADTYYIQASQSRSNALSSGYPSRAEDLFAYDAIVLANAESTQLTRNQQELTRAFVGKRGGGLLVLGAKSFVKPGFADTPIEEVLPLQLVDRSGTDTVLPASSARGMNRVALTTAGEAHPVMQLGSSIDDTRKHWDMTPALASTVPLGGPRPGASVLAITGGAGGVARPLVAVERYGHGRSLIFAGEGAWRWRMLLPSSDRSYDTFWRQALRWLALPAADPVAIDLPAGASPGEDLTVRVLARDAGFVPQLDAVVDVDVTGPDGRHETIHGARPHETDEDGGYVARFRAEGPGVYRVHALARRGTSTIGSASAALLVGGSDAEMTDPRLNLQVLQRLALRSGGGLVARGEAAALAGRLREAVPAARRSVTHELWHTGWSFAAIVVLLTSEWLLRRRWGLR
ncbi:MAG: glutamine amidotransferase [Vicinamibacterales bacterium]